MYGGGGRELRPRARHAEDWGPRVSLLLSLTYMCYDLIQ